MQRILFMGTPIFACGILECLVKNNYHVVGVISQPDKKVGRKQILTPTPVKACALEYGIPVYQPEKIKDFAEQIQAMDLDLIVTCAYGQMIPESIFDAPKHGCVNVHASLLPKLRGGAPIHKAIITGEEKSGVSIMKTVKRMDAGAVCHMKEVAITEEDTMGSLHDKLMVCGQEALLEVIDDILADKAVFVEQDESGMTIARNISKEEEKVDFTQSAKDIYNQMRGLIPAPVSYAYLDGKKVKFHEVSLLHKTSKQPKGTILGFENGKMLVSLESDTLAVTVLQCEGKAKISAKDYENGAGRQAIGHCFN